jgi:hypothetical protein
MFVEEHLLWKVVKNWNWERFQLSRGNGTPPYPWRYHFKSPVSWVFWGFPIGGPASDLKVP